MGRGRGRTCARQDGDEVVLVTGAAGFIGRNLCRALRAAGTTVLGVDDFSAPESLRAPDGSVDRATCSISGFDDLAGVTTVVHLAARKSVPASFANRDDIARNVLVDRHLLEIVSRASVAPVARRELVRGVRRATGRGAHRRRRPVSRRARRTR